jgi:hypothetical protein
MMIDAGDGASMSYAMAYNAEHIYIAGHSTENMTLNGPGGQTAEYIDNDDKTDMYVAKIALDGEPLKVFSVAQGSYSSSSGGSSFGLIMDIQDLGDDHLAITGYFDGGQLTWGSSGIVLENMLTYSNSFVAKVSVIDGSTVWATLQASDRETKNQGVDTDADGNVYAVGYYYSCCNEDDPIYSNGVATGEYEANEYGSIFKYDAATGVEVWSKKWTGISSIGGVRIDTSGVYVVGTITGVDVVIGGAVSDITSASDGASASMLVMKLDLDGNPLWATTLGCSASGFDISLSEDGTTLYVGGGAGCAATVGSTELTGDLGGLAAALDKGTGTPVWAIDTPYLRDQGGDLGLRRQGLLHVRRTNVDRCHAGEHHRLSRLERRGRGRRLCLHRRHRVGCRYGRHRHGVSVGL